MITFTVLRTHIGSIDIDCTSLIYHSGTLSRLSGIYENNIKDVAEQASYSSVK